MKTTTRLASLRALLVIALLSLLPTATFAQGEDRDLTLAAITSMVTNTQLPPASPHGYLKVYSGTDKFNDGDAWYFPHSSYIVYAIDGKLVKKVPNHISQSDEIPEVVTLPVGAYMIDARSEQDGYVRIRVAIRAGRQTVLNLDTRENNGERLVVK